ncbi:MAG: hypothetical protein KatS3mg050_1906 [Litorilinea sp.]|nr:MAG: hypothetical protein KatS3mg050_1906 [Litorilinea sp.]
MRDILAPPAETTDFTTETHNAREQAGRVPNLGRWVWAVSVSTANPTWRLLPAMPWHRPQGHLGHNFSGGNGCHPPGRRGEDCCTGKLSSGPAAIPACYGSRAPSGTRLHFCRNSAGIWTPNGCCGLGRPVAGPKGARSLRVFWVEVPAWFGFRKSASWLGCELYNKRGHPVHAGIGPNTKTPACAPVHTGSVSPGTAPRRKGRYTGFGLTSPPPACGTSACPTLAVTR